MWDLQCGILKDYVSWIPPFLVHQIGFVGFFFTWLGRVLRSWSYKIQYLVAVEGDDDDAVFAVQFRTSIPFPVHQSGPLVQFSNCTLPLVCVFPYYRANCMVIQLVSVMT